MAELDELGRLAADLRAVANISPVKVRQSLQQTAFKSRDEWRKLAAGNPLGRQYTATIDYTIKGGKGDITAEIGPNLKRYGGKTGKGGLVPSAGIFDDPLSQGSIRRAPDRARRAVEKFAADELDKGVKIAIDQSLKELGL